MDLRQAIWEARIVANASLRYYDALADRYAFVTKSLQFVSLLLSSGAVAALLTKAPPSLALSATAASAIALAFQTSFAPAGKAAGALSAARHWRRRSGAWDLVWLEFNDDDTRIDIERFVLEHARDLDFEEPDLRYDRALSTHVQLEAVRTLSQAEPGAQ
jgi:hypothetical protein